MKYQKEKKKLLEAAKKRNPKDKIIPCGKKKTLDECYVNQRGVLQFWYNTSATDSTQMIQIQI